MAFDPLRWDSSQGIFGANTTPVNMGLFMGGLNLLGGQGLQGFGQGFGRGILMQNQMDESQLARELKERELEMAEAEAERTAAAAARWQSLLAGDTPVGGQPTGAPPSAAIGPGPAISAQPLPPTGSPAIGYNAGVSASGSPGTPGGGSGAPAPMPPASATGGAVSPLQTTMNNLDPMERATLGMMDPEEGLSYLRDLTQKRITGSSNFRKEFMRESGDFIEVQTKYANLNDSLGLGTGAGDQAGMVSFFKMIDPTSTVREGEVASIQEAGSVPTRLISMYNQMIRTGEKLGPQQREELRQAAEGIYQGAMQEQRQRQNQFGTIASNYGYSLENAVPDLTRSIQPKTASTAVNDAVYEDLMSAVEREIEDMGGM